MTILLLTTTFPATRGDGTPSFVSDLALELADRHEVWVLAPRIQGAGGRQTTIDGVTVVRFPYFLKKWERLADGAIMPAVKATPILWLQVPCLVLGMLIHAVRLSARESFDLLNPHWILPAGLVARILNARRGVRYVVTVHGADAFLLDSRWLRHLKRWVLSRAARVIPVSKEIRDVMLDLGLKPEIVCPPIPMGVAADEDPTSIDRVLGRFLFVGRLAEKKGARVAIEAMVMVPEAELTVIGDGPEQDQLVSISVGLGVSNRVQFVGRQPRERVLNEMRTCFGVVIPSIVSGEGDREGTPVVLAEAAASGTPVIASRLAGLGEHIEHGITGVLVSPGDPSLLAAAMNEALEDPRSFMDMGRAAQQQFAGSVLDISVTRDRYFDVFESVTS